MTDLKEQFTNAAKDVKTLTKRPDNATLLKLYALYKQATEGNVQGKRPGFTDLKGRAKYDAWAGIKGMTSEKAMEEYISLVNRLLQS